MDDAAHGAARVLAGHVEQRGHHALRALRMRLAAPRARAAVFVEEDGLFGVRVLHVPPRPPGPLAEARLAQARVAANRAPARQQLRRSPSALQIGGHKHVHRQLRDQLRGSARLRLARRVQRHIGVALQQVKPIPVLRRA